MYIKDGSSKDYGNGNKDSYEYLARDLAHENLTIDEYKKLKDRLSYVCSSKRYNNLFMWGWLGDKVLSCGWNSEALKKKIIKCLKEYPAEYVVDHYCGFHGCEVCREEGNATMATANLFEGSIKIRYKDKIYCCPRGVEHYIESHDYKPPDEVLLAVLEGEYITPKIMLEDLVKSCRIQIIKEIQKEKEKLEISKEAEQRRKEAEERRMKFFSPRQRELIKEAVNRNGDFVPLECD